MVPSYRNSIFIVSGYCAVSYVSLRSLFVFSQNFFFFFIFLRTYKSVHLLQFSCGLFPIVFEYMYTFMRDNPSGILWPEKLLKIVIDQVTYSPFYQIPIFFPLSVWFSCKLYSIYFHSMEGEPPDAVPR